MELPTITKSAYATTAYNPDRAFHEDVGLSTFGDALIGGNVRAQKVPLIPQPTKEKFVSRIVRVFIADPNENIPLDKRIIYKSDEFHTDLTDQELFFDANPSAMLAKHNEYRVTVLNKKLTEATGKEHKLEAARIRDLKMVVVDLATF